MSHRHYKIKDIRPGTLIRTSGGDVTVGPDGHTALSDDQHEIVKGMFGSLEEVSAPKAASPSMDEDSAIKKQLEESEKAEQATKDKNFEVKSAAHNELPEVADGPKEADGQHVDKSAKNFEDAEKFHKDMDASARIAEQKAANDKMAADSKHFDKAMQMDQKRRGRPPKAK